MYLKPLILTLSLLAAAAGADRTNIYRGVLVPASQRHRPDSLPNPGGKWRGDNDAGWMAPGYEFVKAERLCSVISVEHLNRQD